MPHVGRGGGGSSQYSEIGSNTLLLRSEALYPMTNWNSMVQEQLKKLSEPLYVRLFGKGCEIVFSYSRTEKQRVLLKRLT